MNNIKLIFVLVIAFMLSLGGYGVLKKINDLQMYRRVTTHALVKDVTGNLSNANILATSALEYYDQNSFLEAYVPVGQLRGHLIHAEQALDVYAQALLYRDQSSGLSFRLRSYFAYYFIDLEGFIAPLQNNTALSPEQYQRLKDTAHDIHVLHTHLSESLLEDMDPVAIDQYLRTVIEPQLLYPPVQEVIKNNP